MTIFYKYECSLCGNELIKLNPNFNYIRCLDCRDVMLDEKSKQNAFIYPCKYCGKPSGKVRQSKKPVCFLCRIERKALLASKGYYKRKKRVAKTRFCPRCKIIIPYKKQNCLKCLQPVYATK